jgi:addiction module HigA family antidote
MADYILDNPRHKGLKWLFEQDDPSGVTNFTGYPGYAPCARVPSVTPRTLLLSITTRQGERHMTMKNRPHPGSVVLRQCIGPLGLTITDAAEALGVTRNTVSELVNEKRGISPEMAVRLSKVFGGTEEGWLVQQAQYDLAQVRRDRIKLKRLELA